MFTCSRGPHTCDPLSNTCFPRQFTCERANDTCARELFTCETDNSSSFSAEYLRVKFTDYLALTGNWKFLYLFALECHILAIHYRILAFRACLLADARTLLAQGSYLLAKRIILPVFLRNISESNSLIISNLPEIGNSCVYLLSSPTYLRSITEYLLSAPVYLRTLERYLRERAIYLRNGLFFQLPVQIAMFIKKILFGIGIL